MNKDLKFGLAFLGVVFAAYLIWDVFADQNNATRETRERIEQLDNTRPPAP